MQYFNNLAFLFFYLFLSAISLYGQNYSDYHTIPYPAAYSQGKGYSGSSLGEDIESYINPALLSRKNIMGFSFDRKDYTDSFVLFSGIFFPLGDHTMQLSGISQNVETLDGIRFSAGTGKLFFLQSGYSLSYYNNNALNERIYNADLGLLFSETNKSNSFFGIHQFSLGLRTNLSWIDTPTNDFLSLEPSPGVSIKVLNSNYFHSYVWLDYPYKRSYIYFPTYFGFNLVFFNTIDISMGFTGNEYFETTNHHISFSAKSPLNKYPAEFRTSRSGSHLREIDFQSEWTDFYFFLGYNLKNPDSLKEIILSHNELPAIHFSPNNDSSLDSAEIPVKNSILKNMSAWNVLIINSDKNIVYQIPDYYKFYNRDSSKIITWDGRHSSGNISTEGNYTAILSAIDKYGKLHSIPLAQIVLDNTPPMAKFEVVPNVIKVAPDKDNYLSMKLSEVSETSITTIQLQGTKGIVFEKKCGSKNCTFDWKPDPLNVEHSGKLNVIISMIDSAGNVKTISDNQITVLQGYADAILSLDSSSISSYKLFSEGISIHINTFDESIEPEKLRFSLVDSNGELIERAQNINPPYNQITIKPKSVSSIKKRSSFWVQLDYKSSEDELVPLASKEVKIDDSPPSISLNITPEENFLPTDIPSHFLYINSEINDSSDILDWKLEIKNNSGKVFFQNNGKGSIPSTLRWDGKTNSEIQITALSEYTVEIVVTDLAGNTTRAKEDFQTGLFLLNSQLLPVALKNGVVSLTDSTNLTSPYFTTTIDSIYFQPNSAEPLPGFETKLSPIIDLMTLHCDLTVRVEGHVHASINIENISEEEKKKIKENRINLSRERAESLKKHMHSKGISLNRIEAVGKGGEEPVALDNSIAEISRNRRVEFIFETSSCELLD